MSQLVTIPELKNFLSIKTSNMEEDGRLSNIAVQVSSLIASYCGRIFESNTYTEYFDGGRSSVYVANPPLNLVNELSQYNGQTYTILGTPDTTGAPITIEGQAHSISKVGNPLLKTRVKKLGRSSIYLDGSSYLSTDSNEDWDLGVDDFTIEVYARFNNTSSSAQTIVSSGNASHYWSFGYNNGLFFKVVDNNIVTCNVVETSNTVYNSNEFYHVAISRDNNKFYLAKNGNIVGNLTSAYSIANYGTGLLVGKYTTGYLDNLRIDHHANYTTEYTNPQYTLPANGNTKLLLHFDGGNNGTEFTDQSRKVNEYLYYPVTGEITFDTGYGGGQEELGFYRPIKSENYANGVKVIYNGGFDVIPDDLKLAALEMSKVIYKGKSGSESVSFQGESMKSFSVSIDDFPPQVRRILNLYRLID
jgi:hypothetical protein